MTVKFGKKELQNDVKEAFKSMHAQGMPMDVLKKIMKVAEPIGDFEAIRRRYNMSDDEFNELFSGPARKYGLNGKAVPDGYAYGSSSICTMLGWSPYKDATPENVWKDMKGIDREIEEDPTRDMIFYSGHEIEPVYRHYFKRLYGDRYIVIECDVQWHSKLWPHFIGNVDGLLIDKETGDLGILEIKHTDYKVRGGVKEGFTNSEDKYDTVEECFMNNKSTRGYLMQGDGYMEMFHDIAKFTCFFLGWGNRCDYDSTAMVRIDRDPDRGQTMLDSCENFIEDYVIADVKPDYKTIKETSHYSDVVKEVFKEVDPAGHSITFDPSMQAQAEALIKAKEALDAKHEEVKKLQKEEEELTKILEEHQAPFIEALDKNPKGYMEVGGKRMYVTFNVPNGLDEEKLRKEYPAEAAACETKKISATQLKKNYGYAYNKCYGPKVGASRKFSVKIYEK